MLMLVSIQARVLPGSLSELLSKYDSPSTRPGLSTQVSQGDGSTDNVKVQFYIDRYHEIDQKKKYLGVDQLNDQLIE